MMRTKLFFSVLLSFSFYLLSSQVPQGFNYQAIARNDLGDPIANTPLPVTITVQSQEDGGTVFLVEKHTITTDAFGLFKLIIGEGSRQSGEAAAFSDIDWRVLPKFIKTQIYYDSELKDMGTSALLSVPYSMVAGNINDTLNKLYVKGETTDMEEALFQVKNKDGQIIFAVYNEGVRVYVADGETKGKKGGFAIGGFGAGKADAPGQEYFVVSRDSIRAYIYDDPLVKRAKGGFAIGGFGAGKGFTNDYLLISPDSARVYIDNAPSSKGKKGGFAIGGFGAGKGIDGQEFLTVSGDSIRMYIDDESKRAKGGFAIGGFGAGKAGNSDSFFDVATDATGIINPSQNRILWYPLKNAFLTGRVRIGTPDSVGINSFSTGYESKARGMYSQAMGFKSIANGDYSTAIGKNAVAHKDNSFAFGENSYAGNIGSFALGIGSQAIGLGSFALGFEGRDSANNLTGATIASGLYSMAFGMGAKSTSKGSLAIGTMSEATYEYSTAIGYQTKAQNWYATAVGFKTQANGIYSSAFGFKSRADGESSVALGRASAGGKLSVAFGNSYAGGEYSVSMGNSSVALGYTSIAAGYENSAVGNSSAAFGGGTFANGLNTFASGYATIAEADYAHAIGMWNIGFKVLSTMDITDPLYNPVLEVGNGSGSARTNALSVLRNGQMIVGTHDSQFIEDQIMFNDPPHTLNIKGRKPWTDQGYFGLFVQGETQIEGDIMPYIVNSHSIGSSTSPWKSIYASNYYGNGSTAYFYANILPNVSNTRSLGSSSYRWNTAFINSYYGNSSNIATFVATVVPSGTRNLGSTSAYWSSLYGRQIILDGSKGLTELKFTKSGIYAGAVGYNLTENYLYLYEGDNFCIKDGKVGIGTTTPGYKLTVAGTAWCSSGAWTGSDLRWKKNIARLNNIMPEILELTAVEYELRTDEYPDMNFEKGTNIGLIAQDIEKIFPQLVRTDNNGYKSVSYEKLSVLLLKGIQEQQKDIESTKQENIQLKSELDLLKARMEQIEVLLTSTSAK